MQSITTANIRMTAHGGHFGPGSKLDGSIGLSIAHLHHEATIFFLLTSNGVDFTPVFILQRVSLDDLSTRRFANSKLLFLTRLYSLVVDRKVSAWLITAALLLATAGCSYRDMGVGKSKDMTPQEAEDYAKSAYGELPIPIEDRPGAGPVVQPDRMVTVDFVFNDTDNNESNSPRSSRMQFFLGTPPWRGRVRFLYQASGASLSGETFDYISPGHATPALLAAMAGMREGGTRSVSLTDFCDDLYHTNICQTSGNEWDKTKAGERRLGVWYPRGTPLLVNITIIRVCRPTIILEHTPDVMGGGAGQNIKETSCR